MSSSDLLNCEQVSQIFSTWGKLPRKKKNGLTEKHFVRTFSILLKNGVLNWISSPNAKATPQFIYFFLFLLIEDIGYDLLWILLSPVNLCSNNMCLWNSSFKDFCMQMD